MLRFLFGSKDGLVKAVLERARQDELAALATVRAEGQADLAVVGTRLWSWLAARTIDRCWCCGWRATPHHCSTRTVRGPLLDLLATGDRTRTTGAVLGYLDR